jgi:antitoxin (DNA-binding transcriptional repressor) of toxin-antitoxin stability system
MVAERSSQYSIHDAKTNLSRTTERAEHGEAIIISRKCEVSVLLA